MQHRLGLLTACSVAALTAGPAFADGRAGADAQPAVTQPAAAAGPSDTNTLDEVIVTGTRTQGLKASDSAAPVQVLDVTSLQRVGQPDLLQALSQNVPSLEAQSFVTDAAQLSPSFKLRGLSPNDTLVLINGKRRHGTANLAVIASPYQGGAAPDISFIPVDEIARVEVLTDGAAAQYGTDAIAGVINIITKKTNSGGNIILNGGSYFNQGGDTADAMINFGFAPLGDKSWLNLTYESKFHGHSNRGAVDPRLYNHAVIGSSVCPAAYQFSVGGVLNCNNVGTGGHYANAVNYPGYPYNNQVSGDALFHLNTVTWDTGYNFNEDWQVYSFGSYGHKNGQAFENYRTPDIAPSVYPLGFSPKEELQEDDYSVTVGIKGKLYGWNADLSSTYGRDDDTLYTENTINSTALSTLGLRQTKFYDGQLIASEWTTNLDLSRDFAVGLASPLTVAVGVEGRHNTYDIKAGEPYSYLTGGAQSYPGFSTIVSGDHSRDNVGVYADFAVSPVAKLKLDLAGRYEHYSDFGDTAVGKGTARYDFNPIVAVRGTISTGFRAPTLAEEFYSSVNVSPTSASGQFPPNSPGVAALGFKPLKPETSNNFSAGVVLHPMSRLTATVDAYYIELSDRIVGSGTILGVSNGAVVSAAVNNALAASGYTFPAGVTTTGLNLFANGLDTETTGVDAVVTYVSDLGGGLGRVDWTLSGTYDNTAVTRIAPSPAQIQPQLLFDKTAISFLQNAPPKYKLIGGALWTVGRLSVNLRETLYGDSSLYSLGPDNVTYFRTRIKPTPITDLQFDYDIGHGVKLTAGANNLFNTYPDRYNPALLAAYALYNRQGGTVQYPTSFTPFGYNGGFYYLKATYTF